MVAVGIDLGTTHSVISYYDPETKSSIILPDQTGKRIVPSIVTFLTESNQIIVGDIPNTKDPMKTVELSKRWFGTDHLFLEKYTAVDINAIILNYMLSILDYHGLERDTLVITVPAYFNHTQRNHVMRAAFKCDVIVDALISEPTAAAIAYGFLNLGQQKKTIAVVDLGGGTHDVSIMELSDNLFTVLGTSGNPSLGGEDINRLISSKFPRLSAGRVEKIKRKLSDETSVEIPEAETVFTRKDFIKLCQPFWQDFLRPIQQVMNDTNLVCTQIDEVILVGGSTRIPYIRQLVGDYFQRGLDRLNYSLDPDEAIAYGAAIHSHYLVSKESAFMILDVIPMTIGVKVGKSNMFPLIPRNSFIPISHTEKFSTNFKEQKQATIELYQGESSVTNKNLLISTLTLNGLENQDDLEITVTIDIDSSGIMTFSATCLNSKHSLELNFLEDFNELEQEIEF